MSIHRTAGSLFARAAALSLLASVALGALPGSQETDPDAPKNPTAGAQAADRLGDRFATFLGGETNADALITGLHNGTAVTLTTAAGGQTATFTAANGSMAYGNIFVSLALAEEQLNKLGITQPTLAEIQAALDGGSITTGSGSTATTTQLTGVLVLRQQGREWGQIAQSLGVDLHTAIAHARAASDPNEAAEAGQPAEKPAGTAQNSRAIDRLSDRFAKFAGGEANATSLVTGLQNGTAITLTAAGSQIAATTFTPATGPMGLGNVALSLSLAQGELAKLGITQPTMDQIQAALDGGSVTTGTGSTATTTSLTGVLVLRQQGQGWGQIAQALGVSLHPAEHGALATANDAMGRDEKSAASGRGEAVAAPAAASDHPDTAASAHADMAASAHSNASARPAMVAGGRPPLPPMNHFTPPDIQRPLPPGRH